MRKIFSRLAVVALSVLGAVSARAEAFDPGTAWTDASTALTAVQTGVFGLLGIGISIAIGVFVYKKVKKGLASAG